MAFALRVAYLHKRVPTLTRTYWYTLILFSSILQIATLWAPIGTLSGPIVATLASPSQLE